MMVRTVRATLTIFKQTFNLKQVYRGVKFLRDGYALFLSFPLSILSFLTITYSFLVERIPFLHALFPNFYIYCLCASFVVVPLGIFLGWFHMQKSRFFATEVIVTAESNPLQIRTQRLLFEMLGDLWLKSNTDLPKGYKEFYAFWKRLDEKQQWSPPT